MKTAIVFAEKHFHRWLTELVDAAVADGPIIGEANGCAKGKLKASAALSSLALNNDAGAVAVAVAVGLEALVELARHGRVIVNEGWLVWSADVPAKRKAALVVAALLDRDGRRLPREIKALIGPYL